MKISNKYILQGGLIFFFSLVLTKHLWANHDSPFGMYDTIIPKSYNVNFSHLPIKIDGKMNDAAWKKASWTDWFVDIEGDLKPKPLLDTRVKLLWDSQYLYIATVLKEPHLWATLLNHDDIIYRDHDFEVFIDPNNDENQYFEIEINTLGTVMDLLMHKSYKNGGPMDMSWNTEGLQSAIQYKGTLNDNRDIDKGWTLEMAIPYACLKRPGRNYLPTLNQPWRINFSRVEWTLQNEGNSYVKKLNDNGKPIPEFNWVWSPMGLINMHVPNRWGYLYFKQ